MANNSENQTATSEEKKFVMNGALLKCTLCSNPQGKLKVTSNSILLQDMLWANTTDTNGAQNLQFDGVCNHTKYGNNKPPCKSVIQLKGWDKPATIGVQNAPAILKESKNYCVPHNNQPIEITNSGQTETNVQKALHASNGKVVQDAYWIVNDQDETKTTQLTYNQEKAFLKIIFNPHAVQEQKKYKIGVYEQDPILNDTIFEDQNWKVITRQNIILSFNMTPALFEKAGDDIAYLFFKVVVEEDKEYEFCNSNGAYLKVHLVRYIPGVIRHLGWQNGAALQDAWFARVGSQNPTVNVPITNVIKMDWVLGYPRAKNVYDTLVIQKIWANAAGKNALVNEIKKMIIDRILVIPSVENQAVQFGVFDAQIVTISNKKIPKFDKYHYQERSFIENAFDANDEDLDDLYAALANFVFRVVAGGIIARRKNHYSITITRVGVYVRDSFNYIDEGWNQIMSQPLGYWDIVSNKASTKKGDGFRYINNESYNKYRTDYNKGGDFIVFSDIKTINTSDEFQMPLNTF